MGRPKGYKHTQQTKDKLSLSKKGISFTDAHKTKLSLAKIGKTPWSKGKQFTEEHRKHLSEAHMGHIPATKGRKFPERSGSNCHLWKGGLTPLNSRIRHSVEYKLWREAVFKRDNFTCVLGGKEHGSKLNPFLRKTENYGGKSIKQYA